MRKPRLPIATPAVALDAATTDEVTPALATGNPTQRIVDAITQAIVERRLMPGTKLGEQTLADCFGVSRTIVRQALNQLSSDYLVKLSPARGAHVAQPSEDEARQVFEVRQTLELSLVRNLANHLKPSALQRLTQHLQDEAAAIENRDIPGRTRLLADFHVLLAELADNQVLAQLLGDLLKRSALIALMYQSSHSAQASHAEHCDIVTALRTGDAERAQALMADHLASVEHNLQVHEPSRPAPKKPDLIRALLPETSQ